MRSKLMVGIVVAIGCLSSAALAEDAVKVKPGTYEIKIDIVGKRQRPMAAIDVARLPVKSTLTELRQPFAGRIEQAIEKDPF